MPETATPADELAAQLATLNEVLTETRTRYRAILTTFGAVVDGMELAAEQVQDKRLELLERPPDVSLGELAVSLLLTFTLHTGAPQRFAAATIAPVPAGAPAMQINAVAQSIEDAYVGVVVWRKTSQFSDTMDALTHGADWRKQVEQVSPAFMHLRDVVRDGSKAQREAINDVNKFLTLAANPAAVGTMAALETARDNQKELLAKGPPAVAQPATTHWDPALFGPRLPPGRSRLVQQRFDPTQGGDAPAVAIRRQIRTTYAELRYFIEQALDQAQAQLLTCVMTQSEEAIDDLLGDLFLLRHAIKDAGDVGVPSEQLREAAALLYEKVIWMLLYGHALSVPPARSVPDPVQDDRLILGVPEPLVKYWWGRFPNPATQQPFPSQPALFEHLKADVFLKLEQLLVPGDFLAVLKPGSQADGR